MKAIFGSDSISRKNELMDSILYGGGYLYDEDFSHMTAAERRLSIMKNALRTLNEEELLQKKLKSSGLDRVFQSTPQFLRDLKQDEIEMWELLNKEYEEEMEQVVSIRREDTQKQLRKSDILTPDDVTKRIKMELDNYSGDESDDY
ncbi:unnamed protein product [Ambrosiozyma monospora]|uniref:Unnamed protein product n=1 Tax=Ambrosiozyma monospora TaxID=43982 RepID=A0ACB5TD46_AMBMO|nr:unnamed protein product [Ambrosiozyma monospora]